MKIRNPMRINIALIAILFIGCNITGCENSPNKAGADDTIKASTEREFKYFSKTYPVPEGMSIWEAQLNKSFSDDRFKKSGLRLLDYTYSGDISTEQQLEEIKQTLEKNNTSVPLYSENTNEFELTAIRKSKDLRRHIMDAHFKTKKLRGTASKDNIPDSNSAYIFKEDDAGLVKLEWDYKGQKLNTLCIVSKNQGIIYDNFLYFISFEPKIIKNSKIEPITQHQAYPSYTTSDVQPGTPISYNGGIKTWGNNWWGEEVWYIEIKAIATGYMDVNNIGVLRSYNTEAYCSHERGYDCAAAINSISFEQGDDGLWEYKWAYSYSSFSTVSINWNGFEFSFGGEGVQRQKGEVVTPGDLTP
jgi:hypothetical protein